MVAKAAIGKTPVAGSCSSVKSTLTDARSNFSQPPVWVYKI
jgi:hypothetical protein